MAILKENAKERQMKSSKILAVVFLGIQEQFFSPSFPLSLYPKSQSIITYKWVLQQWEVLISIYWMLEYIIIVFKKEESLM